MAAANKGECLPGLVGFAGLPGVQVRGVLLPVGPALAVCVCLNVRTNYISKCTSVYARS